MLDTIFCRVEYFAEIDAVKIAWHRFCRGEEYREYVSHALELARENNAGTLIIDARCGFEDEKEDVEWGFSYFIPELAKTSCKEVIVVTGKLVDIGEEMDMWSSEFEKYFKVLRFDTVKRVADYLKSRQEVENG